MRTQAKPIGHMVHEFEQYPSNSISRSKFKMGNSLLTSMNSGYIVPIWYGEALPGDTLNMSIRSFARLATQIVPFMDNVYMDVHVWCCPNRLLWEHWEEMNGEQRNPGDSTDYLTPQITTPTGGATVHSIYDYFGIPIGKSGISFNAFNFRAYNLVYNEWYRDENLINRVPEVKGDTDSYSNYTLLKRGKRKDYFTGALPWPQKGPGVDLPLGLSAPVTVGAPRVNVGGAQVPTAVLMVPYSGSTPQVSHVGLTAGDMDGHNVVGYISSDGSWSAGSNEAYALRWPSTTIFTGTADLTNATAASINTLRQAMAVQRMMETDARGGTRYTEMILAHFGVKSPDARLQRPEFLGGGTFDLRLNVVPQTSASQSGQTPQGNLSSYGVIQGETARIVRSFTEHCTLFAVASIRADLTYQQGLDRSYSRRSRLDYYLPTLANLGEQTVLNKEIFAQGTSADDEVFGYQERWAEYRYKQNKITGRLRSDAPSTLDYWHLSQDFSNLPRLNSEFINENVPLNRVLAIDSNEVSTVPEFICNFYFDEYWVRPMPVYSIPSMSAHF